MKQIIFVCLFRALRLVVLVSVRDIRAGEELFSTYFTVVRWLHARIVTSKGNNTDTSGEALHHFTEVQCMLKIRTLSRKKAVIFIMIQHVHGHLCMTMCTVLLKVHSSSAAVRHDNPMCLRTQDMQLAYVVELNNICVRYLDKIIL